MGGRLNKIRSALDYRWNQIAGPENVVNDDWEATDEVDMTLRLLSSVVSQYSIDKNRLYTTGQSMGGMISFYLNANQPDLFAASIFVASQRKLSFTREPKVPSSRMIRRVGKSKWRSKNDPAS